mgnify:CR=1 FL=1
MTGLRALCQKISIHAPHARSDGHDQSHMLIRMISIHAPHARSDLNELQNKSVIMYFNPRSSCEERRLRISLSTDG